MRKLIPTVICSAVIAAFGPAAVAQTTPYSDRNSSTYRDNNQRDNIHYNIHQRGDQNTSQTGSNNQSSQITGSDNQVNQQSGDQSVSTQQGTGNTSTTQVGKDNTSTSTNQYGSGNTAATTSQQGTQNQTAIGTGNPQSQQMGKGHSADQSSTTADANMKNRQRGDSMSSQGSRSDQYSSRKDDDKERHANRGWHKGWDNPESSGSTRY